MNIFYCECLVVLASELEFSLAAVAKGEMSFSKLAIAFFPSCTFSFSEILEALRELKREVELLSFSQSWFFVFDSQGVSSGTIFYLDQEQVLVFWAGHNLLQAVIQTFECVSVSDDLEWITFLSGSGIPCLSLEEAARFQ